LSVNMMEITLRQGVPQDAQRCGEICYEAFATIAQRHNFPPDLPDAQAAIGLMSMVLGSPHVYSVVAEVQGRIVGSNALWEDAVIAGVGPITVDPAIQDRSIGRKLMEQVLERAHQRRFVGVRLVQAAYHNRSMSLYTKLGFDARQPLSTIQGPALRWNAPGCAVRKATHADLPACNSLCHRVVGHERGTMLRQAIDDGHATVVERHGRISAYSTTVGFFGHSVGENNDDLKALIGAATRFPGPGFLLPTCNAELLRWCLSMGLRIVQPMTLMSLGLYHEPDGAYLPSIIY
jgi:GNAT superfamily N-acetyltransferase